MRAWVGLSVVALVLIAFSGCLTEEERTEKAVVAAFVGPSLHPLGVSNLELNRMDQLLHDMEKRWTDLDVACSTDAPFAFTYLITTLGVRHFVEHAYTHARFHYFDEGGVIAHMSVVFAQRYFDAIDAQRAGNLAGVSGPWREAFTWGASGQSTTLEDVLLGMNAHINYDLAIVAFQLGLPAQGRKDDYDRINDVLASVISEVAVQLARHYDASLAPNAASDFSDPAVLQLFFGWRENAWQNAETLTNAPNDAARASHLSTMEAEAVAIAKTFQTPKPSTTAQRVAYCQANP